MSKMIYVCNRCGSPRVFADAYKALNSDEVHTYDNTFCEDCDGECRVTEVEVPEDFDISEQFYPLEKLK